MNDFVIILIMVFFIIVGVAATHELYNLICILLNKIYERR
jgi:hypothetical protein